MPYKKGLSSIKTVKILKKGVNLKPKRAKNRLKGLENITKMLIFVLNSANIYGEKPLSCLLIAPVSSGKTTAIKQFNKNKRVLITTDTTAWGILNKYQDKLKSNELRHIIIPDLLNALSRRKTTVDSFLTFINASCEDGLFPSKTFGIEINEFIQPFGWILCLTKDAYNMKKKYLKGIGFESRFFIIHHRYSAEQIKEILKTIISEERFEIPEIKLKNNKRKIKGNIKIFEELSLFSKMLCGNFDDNAEILRFQRKLQTLIKACAYTRGGDGVINQDLDNIKELIPFIKE